MRVNTDWWRDTHRDKHRVHTVIKNKRQILLTQTIDIQECGCLRLDCIHDDRLSVGNLLDGSTKGCLYVFITYGTETEPEPIARVLTALFFVGLKQSGHSVALRMTRQSSPDHVRKAGDENIIQVKDERKRGDLQEVAIPVCFWMGKAHADLKRTLVDTTHR